VHNYILQNAGFSPPMV